MTDIELEKKSYEYAEKAREEDCTSYDYTDEAFICGFSKGYILGFKKNNNVWHDLRKNSQDLPDTGGKYLVCTGGESFVASFDTEKNVFGYWYTVLGENLEVSDEMFETLEEIDEGDVIAWCKLPIFEG